MTGLLDDRPAPLAGVHVLELGEGRGEGCGRLLSDLGADVIKVEPPGGSRSRSRSLSFAMRNAGKRSRVIDFETTGGRDELLGLLDAADIWLMGATPRALAAADVDVDHVRASNPGLIVISISDFGQTGPYHDWVATDWVLLAMGGVLSRSGLPGRPPLPPPGEMTDALTAAQAAWAVLTAYWNRLETGLGDHIDFSRYEATAQAIEPAMGTVGTAQAAGYAPTRDRPAPGPYPIFRCRDGFVRVVLLAPRQWHAMRAWLGDPPALRVPELETIRGRALAADQLHAIFEQHFAARSRDELTLEGQARGVPVAPVLTLDEVVRAEHFRVRGAIDRREIAAGVSAEVPTGFAEIDGRRLTFGRPAPAPGELGHLGWAGPRPERAESPDRRGLSRAQAPEPRRPFDGLRILDFGVIVFGAELARLFCEFGAEVIKVESREFPDGARISPIHFAIGHRGSRSLGVNLRSPEGIEVINHLASEADALVANFKPGTLEKLGLGEDELRRINPRLVILSGSALGATGPWSSWMGYGPLVRCVSGLTSLWRYPEDEESFSDSSVVHPDHYAARLAAVTTLAALIDRRRTGRGAAIGIAQAESILMQLAGPLAARAVLGGPEADARAEAAPWGVYPCAGEDEWCVITVRDDDDWRRLGKALGAPAWAAEERLANDAGRVAYRAELDARLTEWTSTRAPRQVAELLQRAGVPAGFMQRADEYERDPQFQSREFLRTFEQPGLDPMRIEYGPVRSERIPLPPEAPSPELGAHTREICSTLLGMDDAEIERLLAAGVLQEPTSTRQDAVGVLQEPASTRQEAGAALSPSPH